MKRCYPRKISNITSDFIFYLIPSETKVSGLPESSWPVRALTIISNNAQTIADFAHTNNLALFCHVIHINFITAKVCTHKQQQQKRERSWETLAGPKCFSFYFFQEGPIFILCYHKYCTFLIAGNWSNVDVVLMDWNGCSFRDCSIPLTDASSFRRLLLQTFYEKGNQINIGSHYTRRVKQAHQGVLSLYVEQNTFSSFCATIYTSFECWQYVVYGWISLVCVLNSVCESGSGSVQYNPNDSNHAKRLISAPKQELL